MLPAAIVWGVGTALGELPPYFVTRAAKRAGKRAGEFDEELADAQGKTDLISKMKVHSRTPTLALTLNPTPTLALTLSLTPTLTLTLTLTRSRGRRSMASWSPSSPTRRPRWSGSTW